MNAKIRRQLRNRKQRILRRLDKFRLGDCDRPLFQASNIHYEIADRTHGICHGGIGALHLLAGAISLLSVNERFLGRYPREESAGSR